MDKLIQYIQKCGKTHIIFDFDETLGRFLLPWEEWDRDVADKVAERAPYLKGKSYVDIHNKYVKSHGKKALNHIRILNETFETSKLKGIERNYELISFMLGNPKYKYYIWSSNSRKTIEHALRELGILDKFSKIITRSETKYIKPDPYGFFLIENSDTNKDEYLFIGNSRSDEKAAEAIGIDFFKVDYFESLY